MTSAFLAHPLPIRFPSRSPVSHVRPVCSTSPSSWQRAASAAAAAALAAALLTTPTLAADVDVRPQLKISGGSASTSGGSSGARSVIKTVTRGVTLENADFSNSDFDGVSFQQSILRQANFSNSILHNASFFDADLTGANFTNADMTGANVRSLTSVSAEPYFVPLFRTCSDNRLFVPLLVSCFYYTDTARVDQLAPG